MKSRLIFFIALLCTLGTFNPTWAAAPVGDAIKAAARGDAIWLLDWIANGGNPDQADAQGWTPLLIASARGQAASVEVLLNNPNRKANPGVRFAPSGALPIHMAGQSGDVSTAKALLVAQPSDINEAWLLNGHTLLLQAAFYGHLDLAKFAIEHGANPAATTVRGLTALDFARQFDNRLLIETLTPSAPSPEAKAANYKALIEAIREQDATVDDEAQRRSNAAATAIFDALKQVGEAPEKIDELTAFVTAKLEGVDVNALATDLRQPLLIVTVTGNNTGQHPEAVAALRLRIARLLLDRGAGPLVKEKHPMGAHAIIRASVFGHIDILRLMGSRISSAELADALNEIPVVNGLTALHDAVLRASTVPDNRVPAYLEQIRWEIGSGARSDIEDFSGRTQHKYAEDIADPARRKLVLDALDSAQTIPRWNHMAIVVPALEPAMQWYSDIFGLVSTSTKPYVHTPAIGERWKTATATFGEDISEIRFIRMRAPDAPFKQVIELFEILPPPPLPIPGKRKSGYVHAGIIVGDPSTTADRISARGGKILNRIDLSDLTIIFCEDPYGNIIELASAPW